MPYALIAEPDAARASLLRRILTAERMEVAIVADGRAALQSMQARGAPSLIVMNLMLTGLDGFGVLGELRKTTPFDKCPAVVISAFSELRQVAWNLRDKLGIAALIDTDATHDTIRRAVQAALVGTKAREPEPAPTRSREAEERKQRDRLAQIQAMHLGDERSSDAALQRLVAETARAFHVPIAVISLQLADRTVFKAHVGLPNEGMAGRSPQDFTFFKHVNESGEPLVIPDAAMHPLFASNPLVRAGAVRSCAAAPLRTPEGMVLGSLGILDTKPLAIKPEDVEALKALARRVSGELALRVAAVGTGELAGVPSPGGGAPPAGTPEAGRPPALPAPAPSQLPVLPYLEAVLANLESGVLLTDPQRRIILANRGLGVLCGRPVDRVAGLPRDEFMASHMDLAEDPEAFLRRVQLGEGPTAAREDFEVQRPQRRWLRWIARPVQIPSGIGQLDIFSDITAEVDLQIERERMARTDAMTGLCNRRAGEESVAREVARARRNLQPVSFFMCEIDRLTDLNRHVGVGAGDEALKALARLIGEFVVGQDLAVRWTGLVFLGIFPAMTEEAARGAAEQIRQAVGRLRVGGDMPITVSIGATVWSPGEDQNVTLGRALDALSVAKATGGNAIDVR